MKTIDQQQCGTSDKLINTPASKALQTERVTATDGRNNTTPQVGFYRHTGVHAGTGVDAVETAGQEGPWKFAI